MVLMAAEEHAHAHRWCNQRIWMWESIWGGSLQKYALFFVFFFNFLCLLAFPAQFFTFIPITKLEIKEASSTIPCMYEFVLYENYFFIIVSDLVMCVVHVSPPKTSAVIDRRDQLSVLPFFVSGTRPKRETVVQTV